MLWFVGLGISGVDSISVSTQKILKQADIVYMEQFTSPISKSDTAKIKKLAKSVAEVAKKRGVEAFYSNLDETEPFEAPHNSPLVRAFTLRVLDVEHARPTLIRKTGTGDMNVIGNRLNIPVVTYGPGDPHASHTINESVSIDEYLQGIEVLKRTLHHLKRLHDKKKK